MDSKLGGHNINKMTFYLRFQQHGNNNISCLQSDTILCEEDSFYISLPFIPLITKHVCQSSNNVNKIWRKLNSASWAAMSNGWYKFSIVFNWPNTPELSHSYSVAKYSKPVSHNQDSCVEIETQLIYEHSLSGKGSVNRVRWRIGHCHVAGNGSGVIYSQLTEPRNVVTQWKRGLCNECIAFSRHC